MTTIRYESRDPTTGETSWYQQEVPDSATPQQIVDKLEGDYKRQILRLERVSTPGENALDVGKGFLRGALRTSTGIVDAIDAPNLKSVLGLGPKPGVSADASPEAVAKAEAGRRAATTQTGPIVDELLPRRGLEDALDRYMRSGAEGLGGAAALPVGPSGTAQAVGGIGAGLGGQAGADVSGGSKMGEVLGSILGSLGLGAPMSLRSNAPQLAKEALEGVPDAALMGAQSRMREMAAQGMPINLSQGMRTPSNIDDLVAALAQSRFGDQTIQNLRLQPETLALRSRAALGGVPGTPTSPQDAANRAQAAATGAISDARNRANAAYTGALQPGAKVPVAMLEAFERRLDEMIAANPNNASAQGLARAVKERLRLGGTPETEPKALGGGAISSRVMVKPPEKLPEWLDDPAQLKGAVDDAIQSYGANALNTAAPRADLNRYAQEIRNAWKQTVRAGTPGMENAAAAARQVYATEVDPMRKSVTGRVAGVSGANDAREATDKLTSLFAKGTPPGAKSSEILTFEKDIRAKHPGLFADIVATNLADRVSKVLPTAGARTDEEFAAALKKSLAGNPAQERGLRDMLAGAARSAGVEEKPVVDGFMSLIRMATIAEKRPPFVSGLPLTDVAETAGKSKLATTVQLQSYYQAGKRIRMAFSSDAYRTMDRLLNDPEGLALLQDLAKRSSMSPASQAAVAGFFGSEGQMSPNIQE